VAKVVDMVDHGLPVEGLLLRVRELLEFPVHLLQVRGEFLPTELEFTERDDFRLVGIEEALSLPFEALASLSQLCLLGGERGQIVLFALRPGVMERGNDARRTE
jgi:hypothetical protein